MITSKTRSDLRHLSEELRSIKVDEIFNREAFSEHLRSLRLEKRREVKAMSIQTEKEKTLSEQILSVLSGVTFNEALYILAIVRGTVGLEKEEASSSLMFRPKTQESS